MKSKEFILAGATRARIFWDARMRLKRIHPLHFVFLMFALVFLMSTSFFHFLPVLSLQNDSYQLVSTGGTVDYPSSENGDYRLWADDSYWYKKIKPNPKLHPNSDQMIDWLMDYHSDYPIINWNWYTPVIYDTYEDTPVYSVKVAGSYYKSIPFPDPYPIAIPDDGDRSVTIIDWYRNECWGIWYCQAVDGTYTAGGAYAFPLGGSGVMPAGKWTVGGSGCSGYKVRASEIEAGVIKHALGCCLKVAPNPQIKYADKNFVHPPAAHTDRGDVSNYVIPTGARIQLDPAIDLDSLGLSSTGKILAKCLQDYGIVVCEAGGTWAMQVEHDLTAHWNPPYMRGDLLKPITNLITDSYNPWRVIDFVLYPEIDDLSEYVSP